MIIKLLKKLANPLLFYVERSGKSVFRNYCLLNKDGYVYDETYSVQDASKALEYRMELDKKLNFALIAITITVYIIFINMRPILLDLLICEGIWCVLAFACRFVCAELYREFMLKNYGQYRIANFNPPISKEKQRKFNLNFRTKIMLIIFIIILFSAPAFLAIKLMKSSLTAKKPHYKVAIAISKIYNTVYPKNEKVYQMSAYAKYRIENYESALKDYEKIFEISNKQFKQKDFSNFANLLYLEKKLNGTQTALEKFNDYATRKNMTVLQQSQMLWIKSIFAISSGAYEFVLQDYDDLINSLKDKDKNKFYVSSDKAYMLSLMGDYKNAIAVYDYLIDYAIQNKQKEDLARLYAERGFAKRATGNRLGADEDFVSSKIDMYELEKYKPTLPKQGFIVEKF